MDKVSSRPVLTFSVKNIYKQVTAILASASTFFSVVRHHSQHLPLNSHRILSPKHASVKACKPSRKCQIWSLPLLSGDLWVLVAFRRHAQSSLCPRGADVHTPHPSHGAYFTDFDYSHWEVTKKTHMSLVLLSREGFRKPCAPLFVLCRHHLLISLWAAGWGWGHG
jgi:hypothetical protein